MHVLYVDAFSGISGNMFIGALIDAGVPEAYLQAELDKLGVHGYTLTVTKVTKCGIAATYADVQLTHGHEHGHSHRKLSDITAIIDNSSLTAKIKQDAKKVFVCLAQAEAKVHGISVEEVHFHEVGAVDTIVDIVGVIICLQWLNIEEIYVSRVRTGFGFVKCAHGVMPVPAPATAELLKNIPFYQGDIEKELATPTGAALLAVLAKVTPGMPEGFVSETISYGAGSLELAIPNTLRLFKGELNAQEANKKMLVLETNIDDMNPQLYSHVPQKLFAAGAADVWITPIIMKKGRPACTLSVLLQDFLLDDIAQTIFNETSTLGVRYYPIERTVLDRYMAKIKLPYGEIHVKYGKLKGKVVNIAPEFDDCSNLSALTGFPVKRIWQETLRAAYEKDLE